MLGSVNEMLVSDHAVIAVVWTMAGPTITYPFRLPNPRPLTVTLLPPVAGTPETGATESMWTGSTVRSMVGVAASERLSSMNR